MTPEERAVIDAAIERFSFWIADETDSDDLDICAAVGHLLAARERAAAPEPLVWVLRTWRDVRPGDTVRPPASDTSAVVEWCGVQNWHIDPVNVNWVEVEKGDGEVKRVPMPIPMEHDIVRVIFVGQEQHRDMNPDAGVEIQLSVYERDIAENVIGWENRLKTLKGA